MKTTEKINTKIVNYAIDGMVNINEGTEVSELHHKLFNEDYFIIEYYIAEQFLINGPGIFAAIKEITQYETDLFGEANTDFSSSEKTANMYAYIKGGELLSNCPTINNNFDKKITKAMIKKITKELREQLQLDYDTCISSNGRKIRPRKIYRLKFKHLTTKQFIKQVAKIN